MLFTFFSQSKMQLTHNIFLFISQGLALYTMTHELLCQDLVKLKLFVVEEPKYSLLGKVNNTEGMIPSRH